MRNLFYLINIGSAVVKILGLNSGTNVNDTSIVLKICYGETAFLYTGDAETIAEETVLSTKEDLSATVLKVSHHGSNTATGTDFLKEVMPKYAVISVGDGNSYGHPAADTLNRLKNTGVEVFRTDLQGDIICKSDGKNVVFTVEKTTTEKELFTEGKHNETEYGDGDNEQYEKITPVVEQPQQNSRYYILNTNTMKFHYPTCGSVNKIKEKNRAEFTGTREEIVSRGYSACGNCHP